MSADVRSTIVMSASPHAVWDVLTDFPAYGTWNPFMDRIEGVAEVGAKLVVHLAQPGGHGMTFRPTVLAATPGQELRWLGKLGFGGLFDGEHYFVLTPGNDGTGNADGTTHLTHGERFFGILVSLLKGTVKNSHAGFEAFNEALKQRVESSGHPTR